MRNDEIAKLEAILIATEDWIKKQVAECIGNGYDFRWDYAKQLVNMIYVLES